MKLFYDMLIPYMPNATAGEDGKLVENPKLAAARQTMIDLANFQNSGEIIHLYQAAMNICKYTGKDLQEWLLADHDDIEVPSVSLNEGLDICAKALFETVVKDKPFDCDKFLAILLTGAHFAFQLANAQASADNSETQTPAESENENQVSIEDVIPQDT